MKSKFNKILSMALATVSVCATFAFSSCGKEEYKGDPVTGYQSKAVVESNGGFAVQKGEYIYFINGKESYDAGNEYGEVVKGALMRISRNDLETGKLDKAITIVPSLFSVQEYSGGIYIYGDYVYYATPTTDKNIKTGAVESGWLDFKRARLDGREAPEEYFFRVEQNNTTYRFVEVDKVVYCLYEEDGALKSYDTREKVSRTLVVGAETYFYDTTDTESGDVYYTMGVTTENDYKESYNQIYRVNAAARATVNAKKDGKVSYTVAGGKTYSFDAKKLEDANKEAKENKQDEVYDFDDYATYPYVNLGTLVLDGRGKVSSWTQYNAEETNEAKPSNTNLNGYIYTLTTHTDGGLYFTRKDVEGSPEADTKLYYLSTTQVKIKNWNAYNNNDGLYVVAQDGAALTQALFTVVSGTHVYYYVEENALYKVVGNNEPIVMQNTGATGATLWKVENNYLYYIQTADNGANGSKLTRINVNGDQQAYNIAGSLEGEDFVEYKATTMEWAQVNSSWYLPEMFGTIMLYANEQAVGDISYNYIAAANIGKNQEFLQDKNEAYEEARKAIDECEDEQTKAALEYYFQTGERTAFDEWADLYSDEQKEDFEAFVKAVTEEKTQDLQSAFYTQIGKVKADDAEAIAQAWSDSLEITDETEEDEDSSFPVWAIVLISVGGALIIGGVAFAIVWQSKKRKKQALIDATVNAYKRPKIDTTDDKSIDVYADDAEVVEAEETAQAPAEEAVEAPVETAEETPAEEPVTEETQEANE